MGHLPFWPQAMILPLVIFHILLSAASAAADSENQTEARHLLASRDVEPHPQPPHQPSRIRKPLNFIILSSARSASTLTTELLTVPELHMYCAGEVLATGSHNLSSSNLGVAEIANLFKRVFDGTWLEFKGIKEKRPFILGQQIDLHNLQTVQDSLIGFKIFYSQLSALQRKHPFPFIQLFDSARAFFSNFKIIHLIREDDLGRALSDQEAHANAARGYRSPHRRVKKQLADKELDRFIFTTPLELSPYAVRDRFYHSCEEVMTYRKYMQKVIKQNIVQVESIASEALTESPERRLVATTKLYAFLLDKSLQEVSELMSPEMEERVLYPPNLRGRSSTPEHVRIKNWAAVYETLLNSTISSTPDSPEWPQECQERLKAQLQARKKESG